MHNKPGNKILKKNPLLKKHLIIILMETFDISLVSIVCNIDYRYQIRNDITKLLLVNVFC